MPIITITRAQYSGGEQIAERVAQALGAKCISDEVLREAAHTYLVSEREIAQFFQSRPSLWERLTKSRFVHAAYIKATLLDMCMDNRIVYHGNAGQELLREIPHALKVRTMLSFDLRVDNIVTELGYNRRQAEKYVRMIDTDRTKRMQYYYDADWRDPARYDLLIRLDKVTSDFTVNVILDMASQPGYQMTDANESAMKIVHLKSKIYAKAAMRLGSQIANLGITVDDGVVRLNGEFSIRDAYALDDVIAEVRRIEGVTDVKNEMSAGLAVFDR